MSIIRNNEEDNSTELWVNGEFVASWLIFELPESIRGRVESMIIRGIEEGKKQKSKEIRNVLGINHV